MLDMFAEMKKWIKPEISTSRLRGYSRFALLKVTVDKFKKSGYPVNEVPNILFYDFFERFSCKTLQNKSVLLFGENINMKNRRKLRNIFRVKQFPNTYNIIKKLENNELQNVFAIVTNNNKGKNIFNLPYFIPFKFHKGIIQMNITPPSPPHIAKKFCCIVISNITASERIHFALKLLKYKKVDIFGKTKYTNSDNSKLPRHHLENSHLFQQYKFVICFENSFADEYITEKLPNAMLGNAIPIYRGAPNVAIYFNAQSFIDYEGYDKSYNKMMEKIIELDQDDKKYAQFLKQPFITKQNIANIENKEKELDLFMERMMS